MHFCMNFKFCFWINFQMSPKINTETEIFLISFWNKNSKIFLRQNSHSPPIKCIKPQFKRFITPSKFLNSIQLVAFISCSRYFCGKGKSVSWCRKEARHRSIRAVKGWVSTKKKLYHFYEERALVGYYFWIETFMPLGL